MSADDDQTSWEESLRFHTQSVDGEDGNRLDFTMVCNGKRLVVNVCSSSVPDDQITQLIEQYNHSFQEDDDEQLQEVQNEIENIIYEAGWRQFALLAPTIPVTDGIPSLHSILYPEVFYFRLVVRNRVAKVIQGESMKHSGDKFPCLSIRGNSQLPRYSSYEIIFVKKLMGTGFIAKVSINGINMCCKIATRTHSKAVQREYECLEAVTALRENPLIKTPRLRGFVLADDGVSVIGILEDYIPHTMTLGTSLSNQKFISSSRKSKWAEQIKISLEELHAINVVWGDDKLENVLVNSDTDDCYLVDFGGSWTLGWVDVELMETMAGDQQALSKILHLLAA